MARPHLPDIALYQRCEQCGAEFLATKGQRASHRREPLRKWYCSLPCSRKARKAQSPYRDKRERDREYKRRQAAFNHAHGLTSRGELPQEGGARVEEGGGLRVPPDVVVECREERIMRSQGKTMFPSQSPARPSD